MNRANWQRFTLSGEAEKLMGDFSYLYLTTDIELLEATGNKAIEETRKMIQGFTEGLKLECSERMKGLVTAQDFLRKKQEEFSAQWYEADKKRLEDLKKNKKMTSGLTPKNKFYRTSEEYVTRHLRPTIAQNIQDQCSKALDIIEAKRQQVIPTLEENVRLTTVNLQKAQEALDWIRRATKLGIATKL